MAMQSRWADQDDDDSDSSSASSLPPANSKLLPSTKTTGPDSRGIKVVISWRRDEEGNRIRTTTRSKCTTVTARLSKNRLSRKDWVKNKFGNALDTEDESNITIRTADDIRIEDPNADVDLQDEDPTKALGGGLNAFWAKQKQRQLERKYDVEGGEGGAQADQDAKDAAEGWSKVGAGGAAAGGKYVPPGMRGAGGAGAGGKSLAEMSERAGAGADGVDPAQQRRFDDRDQNTIRVTNISEDTTEADLQDLFQPFGRISRVYLAKDRETLISRGFAFISFVHHEDATKAMEKLQGYGYDHLILKLEWAKPSAQKGDAGAESTTFRSGYGKALAQDTKQKVSYASNLTR